VWRYLGSANAKGRTHLGVRTATGICHQCGIGLCSSHGSKEPSGPLACPAHETAGREKMVKSGAGAALVYPRKGLGDSPVRQQAALPDWALTCTVEAEWAAEGGATPQVR
jgi:hypothetical protein